ncbi:hypothetical protein CDD80_5200 [Ophiocordyceps camponoti-rufipedis]|uniref:MARVEL domain-containing protein n=1 Tax=Ophiocordyceps camponoti-rufipedis TaxID=2004952 RepID=A0A2C5XUE0_9HYPO|nr:hypothetical protein CDD80_5200 [Ophiocordyceps camponoti-rufipedis]
MGAKIGVALKSLQWLLRALEFICAAFILAVTSFFLFLLRNNSLRIPDSIRAIEGISGAAALYTIFAMLFVCCFGGHIMAAATAAALDLCFVGAFIYVAVVNRGGAGSCTSLQDTLYGQALAAQETALAAETNTGPVPTLESVCILTKAVLAVAIIIIILFVFTALMEVALARHHRKANRFGPSPANNYTSGYGSSLWAKMPFSRRRRATQDPNTLPEHTHPEQLDARRSYATETTAIGHPADNLKQDMPHYQPSVGYPSGWHTGPQLHNPPAGYR